MFQKGNKLSGGRPKANHTIASEKARAFIVKLLNKELRPIVEKAISQAKDGDAKARDWLSDRGYGKVATVDSVEHKGTVTIEVINYANKNKNPV